jgi:hypothetical protein
LHLQHRQLLFGLKFVASAEFSLIEFFIIIIFLAHPGGCGELFVTLGDSVPWKIVVAVHSYLMRQISFAIFLPSRLGLIKSLTATKDQIESKF